jgi:S-adenosylmethionine:tRNA ribosyltransferase-isomerase
MAPPKTKYDLTVRFGGAAHLQTVDGKGLLHYSIGVDTLLFDYDLPAALIAQHPPDRRGESRMMVAPLDRGAPEHRAFGDLPELLMPGDCLVLNDTRVIPARLLGRKDTGGQAEVFLLKRLAGDEWEALVRPARRMHPGTVVTFGEVLVATVLANPERGKTIVRLTYDGELETALRQVGVTPLPPYIRRERQDSSDRQRYQTVYAMEPGAVAAPTAGLHFTAEMLDTLRARQIRTAFLTLHVGLGTFAPISAERIEDHKMHAEQFSISSEAAETINRTRADGGRVIAVGTTVVRTLESCCDDGGRIEPDSGETDIYIKPGHNFRAIDGMLTNFHLPRSSLIVMVAALVGRERLLELYQMAIKRGYRFYSYGDCMLIV